MAHLLGGRSGKVQRRVRTGHIRTSAADSRAVPRCRGTPADLDEPPGYGRGSSRRVSSARDDRHLLDCRGRRRRSAPLWRAVSSRSRPYPQRPPDPEQFPVRHLRVREGLGSPASRAAGRAADPGSGGRPKRVLLRQRRSRLDGRVHALSARRLARIESADSTSTPG